MKSKEDFECPEETVAAYVSLQEANWKVDSLHQKFDSDRKAEWIGSRYSYRYINWDKVTDKYGCNEYSRQLGNECHYYFQVERMELRLPGSEQAPEPWSSDDKDEDEDERDFCPDHFSPIPDCG